MTLVKICGITRLEDALAAARAGADLVGFVFSDSPRRVDPALAAEIAAVLPASLETVGVFVDEPVEQVRRVARIVGLHRVQLHGRETREEAEAIGLPVIKAFRVRTREDVAAAEAFGFEPFLLDGPGGGRGAPLDLVAQARGRFFLAGGLGPDTVTRALDRVAPFGVDVSSGVERRPGRKDPLRIETFVRRVREWEARR